MVLSPRLAESLLFQPSRGDPGHPPLLLGVQGSDVRLQTADGVNVHGWWYPAVGSGVESGGRASPHSSSPAVLFLHGNAGDISDRTGLAEGLLAQGLSVFLLEYRGYGGSDGSPSEEGLHLDALAGYDFLLAQVGSADDVVIFGRSMGGAVAARLGAERSPGAVILEAAFESLEAMGRSIYPFLPGFLFRRLRGRFDTLSRVPEIECPVLIVHGSEDEIVPLAMGRTLYQASGGNGEWMQVEGAGHNDVFWVGGGEYFQRLAAFVRSTKRGEPR